MKLKLFNVVSFLVGCCLPSLFMWASGHDMPPHRGPDLVDLLVESPLCGVMAICVIHLIFWEWYWDEKIRNNL